MQLKAIRSAIEENAATCSVFYSRLVPSHIFEVKKPLRKIPLNVLNDKIVLCVSAIGCPDAFIHIVREVLYFFALLLPFSIAQRTPYFGLTYCLL